MNFQLRLGVNFNFRMTVLAGVLLAGVAGLLPLLPADATHRLGIFSGRKGKAVQPVRDAFTKQTGALVDLKAGKTPGLGKQIRTWKGTPAIAGTRERPTLAWATALVALKGEAFTRDFLKGLHANDLKILTDNTEVWQGVGRGEFAIGLTNSPNYYLARQNNLPVGVVYPDQDAGGFGTPVNPNAVAVIKGAANPEAAHKFIDFVLSPEGQRILVTQDYEFPLTADVDSSEVPPLKSIKRTAVTAQQLADLEEATLKLLTSLNPNW